MGRSALGWVCVCALGVVPLVGCGEDSSTGGSGGSGGTAGTGGSAGSGGTGGGGGVDTVSLTLTLVVGASGIDRPPLEGAAFCETDTENCEMTDANGQATIEVVVPADKRISYTYTKEGYLSVLYTDVVDETLFTDRSHWTLTDAQMEDLSDAVMTPYPYEGTGTLVVSVDLIGATFELVGASGKAYYFDAQGEPSLDLTSTTTNGQGGFVEVAPDEVEVRLGGTAANCTPLSAWPGSEDDAITMRVKPGFLSWSSVFCDAL